ncbi:MAG: ribosome maturation factor RimM [Chloroflexota bacterium]|nr:ribosome maturation factor RimM [Chloroflexota bacterium]MDE2885336.1 ribosome maturation factor RimM [Chloroflexota bacterium]
MPPAPGNVPQQQPDLLITVGVILGAHGSDGRVRVQPETDNPLRFRRGARLIAGDQDLHVDHVQGTPGGLLLVRFTEVSTRSEATALSGGPLCVPTNEAPDAPPGSYYHYQLVGMAVVDEADEHLGTLTEIIATGANDVYVVTGESAELLLPAVADVIAGVDVDAGRMTVAVPEGLAWRVLRPPRAKPARRSPRRRGSAARG